MKTTKKKKKVAHLEITSALGETAPGASGRDGVEPSPSPIKAAVPVPTEVAVQSAPAPSEVSVPSEVAEAFASSPNTT